VNTDHDQLWACIVAEATVDIAGSHGLRHWGSVQSTGRMIASALPGAIPAVINLFAFIHDSKRVCDGCDPGHGLRAAQFAASLRAEGLFKLPDKEFELLHYACAHHTAGELIDNFTIAACWDADRLDLGRIGVQPRPEFMSTPIGREMASSSNLKDKITFLSICTQGGLQPWTTLIGTEETDSHVSLFSSAVLVSKLLRNYRTARQAQIEIALEMVRRESFPQFPCRQAALFACDSWEQLERVCKYTRRPEGMSGKVYEVTGQSFGPFDGDIPYMAVRTTDPFDRARCYWRGLRTDEPILEYLIAPPITIGRKVGYISSNGSAVID
jgi:uncharacterized protein